MIKKKVKSLLAVRFIKSLILTNWITDQNALTIITKKLFQHQKKQFLDKENVFGTTNKKISFCPFCICYLFSTTYTYFTRIKVFFLSTVVTKSEMEESTFSFFLESIDLANETFQNFPTDDQLPRPPDLTEPPPPPPPPPDLTELPPATPPPEFEVFPTPPLSSTENDGKMSSTPHPTTGPTFIPQPVHLVKAVKASPYAKFYYKSTDYFYLEIKLDCKM